MPPAGVLVGLPGVRGRREFPSGTDTIMSFFSFFFYCVFDLTSSCKTVFVALASVSNTGGEIPFTYCLTRIQVVL